MGRGENWTPEMVALLGTMPDRAVAERLGKTPMSVARVRTYHKIPAFQTQRRWSKKEVALLGTMSDPEAGKRVGRKPGAVAAARAARGIKAFTEQQIAYSGWDEVEREYTSCHATLSELSAKYRIPYQRILKRVHAKGWIRAPK